MSDQDRTEDPTAKRRKEFRDEGKVAQSRDVSAVVLAAVAFGLVTGTGGEVARGALTHTQTTLRRIADVPGHGKDAMFAAIGEAGTALAMVALGGGAVLAACAAAIGIAQTGGLWSGKLLGFRLDRLSLLSGLRRVFGGVDGLLSLLTTLAKAAAIAAVLAIILDDELERLPAVAQLDPVAALSKLGALLSRVTTAALLATGVLAAGDYLITSRRLQSEMRMTKQEVKDEHKQQEGDPQVKQRMRSRMRTIGRNRMLAAVRKASVVVVNPTHYAVALHYDGASGGAPRLVAKGVDHMAAKIREVARKHQVPIVSNPPVARAIHATGRVGREIPAELYEAVARVLAYVYRMGRWRRAA
ncbi:MAG: flagellar type III secretion system protein FlhB [Nannocystaceae bacterium]